MRATAPSARFGKGVYKGGFPAKAGSQYVVEDRSAPPLDLFILDGQRPHRHGPRILRVDYSQTMQGITQAVYYLESELQVPLGQTSLGEQEIIQWEGRRERRQQGCTHVGGGDQAGHSLGQP